MFDFLVSKKRKWLLLVVILLLIGLADGFIRARGGSVPTIESQQNPQEGTSDTDVLSEDTQETGDLTLGSVLPTLITCFGPDGKTARSTRKDCDNLLTFWKNHPPAANAGNSNNNSGSNSSSSNTTPTPTPTVTATPTPTPTPTVDPTPTLSPTPIPLPNPTITSVVIAPCTSSSCAHITTVIVTGTNFTPGARVELIKKSNGSIYNENTTLKNNPDAKYVGGNGSTQIITDFYNLPRCYTYAVRVYFPDPDKRTVTKEDAFYNCN